jgi:hypothetical protein
MFKEDFLMTKKGRQKLAAVKQERERIHQSYVQAGASDSGGEAPQSAQDNAAPAADNTEGGEE